jgi:hypothetical protein
MRLTRRRLLQRAAAGTLAGPALYELVERMGRTPARAAVSRLAPEQHELALGLVRSEGVDVVVPPLHHEVVTARLRVGNLRDAQRDLADVLRALDERYQQSAAGLGVTIAWGLPYFRTHVPAQAARHLPIDRRAGVSAFLDARAFPSDPEDLILEDNDVAVLLRSDRRANIEDAHKRLFDDLPFFRVTSIRRGFAGGGFRGGLSLPKRMAMAAGIPGATLIPDSAELFLGFTSTQKAGLGPRQIANHETLGFVNLRRSGYFRNGTHMHLSHIAEDLEMWYRRFDYQDRVEAVFHPDVSVRRGAQTVRQGPEDVSREHDVFGHFEDYGRIGHTSAMQPITRLQRDRVGPDGTVYRRGTAIPQRADFNTLDNPFAWTATPQRDRWSAQPAAGLHFVSFNPSSDDFHRTRLAMDGIFSQTRWVSIVPNSRSQGFNSVLKATHRQNFLVPPRRHRSFPLAEL